MEDRENKTVAETSFDVLEILPWYRQPKSIFLWVFVMLFCVLLICTVALINKTNRLKRDSEQDPKINKSVTNPKENIKPKKTVKPKEIGLSKKRPDPIVHQVPEEIATTIQNSIYVLELKRSNYTVGVCLDPQGILMAYNSTLASLKKNPEKLFLKQLKKLRFFPDIGIVENSVFDQDTNFVLLKVKANETLHPVVLSSTPVKKGDMVYVPIVRKPMGSAPITKLATHTVGGQDKNSRFWSLEKIDYGLVFKDDGAPVFNKKAELIGFIDHSDREKSYFLSVDKSTKILSMPLMTFNFPSCSKNDLHNPLSFQVALTQAIKTDSSFEVTLKVQAEDRMQELIMEKHGDVYKVSCIILPKDPEAQQKVPLQIEYADGKIFGLADKCDIQTKEKKIELSQLLMVEIQTPCKAVLKDGSSVFLSLSDFPDIELTVGKNIFQIDLSKVKTIHSMKLAEIQEFRYEILVASKGKTIIKKTGTIPISK